MHIYPDAPDLCVHPLIYCNLGARRGTAASPAPNAEYEVVITRSTAPASSFHIFLVTSEGSRAGALKTCL